MTLKFVLSRLDANVGKRVSVSGILIGAGGADGINVSQVSKVADTCPYTGPLASWRHRRHEAAARGDGAWPARTRTPTG
jgi:hypothetical protein